MYVYTNHILPKRSVLVDFVYYSEVPEAANLQRKRFI
jgi:hypothetical protein